MHTQVCFRERERVRSLLFLTLFISFLLFALFVHLSNTQDYTVYHTTKKTFHHSIILLLSLYKLLSYYDRAIVDVAKIYVYFFSSSRFFIMTNHHAIIIHMARFFSSSEGRLLLLCTFLYFFIYIIFYFLEKKSGEKSLYLHLFIFLVTICVLLYVMHGYLSSFSRILLLSLLLYS